MQETVQSIMELKFTNIIVEILIEEYDSLFDAGEDPRAKDREQRKSPPIGPKPNSIVSRLPSQRWDCFLSRPRAGSDHRDRRDSIRTMLLWFDTDNRGIRLGLQVTCIVVVIGI